MNKKGTTLVYILTLFYMIPLSIIFIVNMLTSMFQTTYMELYLDTEKPRYKSDNPVILILLVIAFIVIYIFYSKKHQITKETADAIERISLIFSVAISLFIIFLFRAGVACDGASVSISAAQFLNGNYSSFLGNNYLFRYPHQISLAAFWEIVYYLFGVENFIVLQFVNVIAIFSVVYFFHRITYELFENYDIQVILSLLCIGMLPLYLYATYIYGDVPGMGFSVPAVYFVIKYLNTRKKRFVLPALVCVTFAILLKSNNFVILAAIIIILLLHLIKEKDWFAPVFAVVLLIGPVISSSCISAYYVKEAGMDKFPDGAPMIAWVAMGLQENDYLENGWFNGYNCAVYEECGFDTAKTKAACMDSIKESVSTFVSHPRYAIRFFYKKFVSQWNDAGFQAQINIEWNSRHSDGQSQIALYFIYGNGRFILEWLMNLYHFAVLLGAVVFTIYNIRKTSLSSALVALCVFGGYFFHMFWEAKGRYGLGYFVMCVPMAAYGFWRLSAVVQRLPKIFSETFMHKSR